MIDSRPTGGGRGLAALALQAPPCETCAHEPICVLKIALKKATSVEIGALPLPDGLTVAISAKVECRFYTPVRKPKRVMSEAGRASAVANAAKAREAMAAKRAGAEA